MFTKRHLILGLLLVNGMSFAELGPTILSPAETMYTELVYEFYLELLIWQEDIPRSLKQLSQSTIESAVKADPVVRKFWTAHYKIRKTVEDDFVNDVSNRFWSSPNLKSWQYVEQAILAKALMKDGNFKKLRALWERSRNKENRYALLLMCVLNIRLRAERAANELELLRGEVDQYTKESAQPVSSLRTGLIRLGADKSPQEKLKIFQDAAKAKEEELRALNQLLDQAIGIARAFGQRFPDMREVNTLAQQLNLFDSIPAQAK